MPDSSPTESPIEDDPTMEAAGKTLSQGLARTKAGPGKTWSTIRRKQKVDSDLLADLEEALFTADIGVRTSQKLFSMVEENIANGDLTDSEAVWTQLREEIRKMLAIEGHEIELAAHTPFVIMVVGVMAPGNHEHRQAGQLPYSAGQESSPRCRRYLQSRSC